MTRMNRWSRTLLPAVCVLAFGACQPPDPQARKPDSEAERDAATLPNTKPPESEDAESAAPPTQP